MIKKMIYGNGTFFETRGPWDIVCGGAASCPDGKIRKLKKISTEPENFWSIAASINYRGKSVSGFCSIDTKDYECSFVKFIPRGVHRDIFLEMPPVEEPVSLVEEVIMLNDEIFLDENKLVIRTKNVNND